SVGPGSARPGGTGLLLEHSSLGPPLELLHLLLGPLAVTRHRTLAQALEDRGGVVLHLVVRREIESPSHGLVVHRSEQRLDVLPESHHLVSDRHPRHLPSTTQLASKSSPEQLRGLVRANTCSAQLLKRAVLGCRRMRAAEERLSTSLDHQHIGARIPPGRQGSRAGASLTQGSARPDPIRGDQPARALPRTLARSRPLEAPTTLTGPTAGRGVASVMRRWLEGLESDPTR